MLQIGDAADAIGTGRYISFKKQHGYRSDFAVENLSGHVKSATE